jgi:carboxylesterase type B
VLGRPLDSCSALFTLPPPSLPPCQMITIFGQSAGSGSVSDHLVAPRSWGLFQRAIMESTGASDWCAQPLNTSMARWPELAAHASCSGGTGAQQLACLRALNSTQIMQASNNLHHVSAGREHQTGPSHV